MPDRHRVVGVGYDPDSSAPTVVLKASGQDADALLDQARRESKALVVQDAALVEQLYRVPIDAPIGRDLFPVMAMLLAQVLELDQIERGTKR